MHFWEIYKKREGIKPTLIVALLFVVTAVVGVGGVVQQLFLNNSGMIPLTDLREVSSRTLIIQLCFHLIPFIAGILAIFLSVKKILLQSVFSLFGSIEKGSPKFIFSAVLFTLCFFVTVFALSGASDFTVVKSDMNSSIWFAALMLLIFVLIQVTFEELLFRAFLPQVLTGLGLTKIAALVLSSVIFGLLHARNPAVAFYGKWFIGMYMLHGLFLGVVALLDKGILVVLGYHFTNNFLTLLFTASEEQVLKVPSFFHLENEQRFGWSLVLQSVFLMTVFFAACYRRFGWSFKTLKET